MTKEQEVFEKVNRIRVDFFDSKYKDIHTDDELEEKYEALGDVLSMLKEKDKLINKQLKENVSLQKELNEENKRCMILANNDKFKEQIIDLMAEFIKNNMSEKKLIKEICLKGKCNNEECHEDDWKECTKQYFKQKATNNG